MSEVMGTKETMEMMEAVKLLLVAGKKVAADGKISAEDIPTITTILMNAGVIVEGFVGIDKIVGEAKDFTAEEFQAVGMKFFAVVKEVKEA